MAGASLKVEFLQYPFTLTIGFLDPCRMLRSDDAQPREEQLRSSNRTYAVARRWAGEAFSGGGGGWPS